MSITALSRKTRAGLADLVANDGLEAMATYLVRNLHGREDQPQSLTYRIVHCSIDAFVTYGGAPDDAAEQVAPLAWELGTQYARRGHELVELDAAFRQGCRHAVSGLQFAARAGVPAETARELRHDVLGFVGLLERYARRGWHQVGGAVSVHEEARANQSPVEPSQPKLDHGMEPTAWAEAGDPYRLVVSVMPQPFPPDSPGSHRVLAGQQRHEFLVPEAMSLDDLARICSGQVVVGPATPLFRQSEYAHLVRRGAALLREGLVVDTRRVVPCLDLLSALVTNGLPGLADLLIAKQLAPMESLSLGRRLREGELLLQWLRLGQPVNQLARDLAIPPQTAHSRLQHLREIFGAALEDSAQRLELILALQHALPRWRVQAAASKCTPKRKQTPRPRKA